jgi:PmbA protein
VTGEQPMDYQELAQRLVGRACSSDVQAEALVIQSQNTMIRVQGGEVVELSSADSRGVGVRIIRDGRTGFSYTSDFDASALEATVGDALALAASADVDEYRGLPDVEEQGATERDLGVYDPSLSSWETENKIAFILAVEGACLGHDRRVVATSYCTYQDHVSRTYLANSQGFAGSHEWTGAIAYLRGVAEDETGQTAGLGLGFSVFHADLDAEAIGREAAVNAIQILGGRPVCTQRASIIMHPFAAVEFLGSLADALTGESMQKGRSFLSGNVGAEIASARVSLVDDGQLVGGFASAPFDGEGVSTSRTAVVVDGRLDQLLYDCYTARKDGTQSTGNAQRSSYRSQPYPAPTNLYLQPSAASRQELIRDVRRGLYVTSTMNTGGINPINGDYSVGASGLWVENGETIKPVTGVTIAGNMAGMLLNLVAVGNDLRFVPLAASVGSPTIVVDDMTIGGAAR